MSILKFGRQAVTCNTPIGLSVSHGEGSYIVDKNGKRYLDFVAGIAVNNLGHGNTVIQEAIKLQVDKNLHSMVYGEFVEDATISLALNITRRCPEALDSVYFTNSGTEANEAAIKLARRVTGRSKIISLMGAYHGSTLGSLSISGNETKKAAFRPLLPDCIQIPLNDLDALKAIDQTVAGVVMETIQGDAGVRAPSQAFISTVRSKCDAVGAKLILDEIQVGMGRTGTMFAFEQFGVIPDYLTLGKALGGGLPIGALVAAKNELEQFHSNPMLGHITTFGGNPVICAAGGAFLHEMDYQGVLEHVEEKGQRLETAIQHPVIKEIRRQGLMLAVDLANEEQVNQVISGCLENGLILFRFLSCPASFRISPPLNISDEDIDKGCAILKSQLDQLPLG